MDCVVPHSAASSYQLNVNVAELHHQPDRRTGNFRVMKSLFCLSPRGGDLRANLGLSPQILGLSLPWELLMGPWVEATTQQKFSQL